MKNENSFTKWEYVFWNLFVGILSLIWYKSFFRVIPKTSYTFSRYILYLLLFVSIVVGAAVTFRKRRNLVSLAVSLLLPFELYAAVTFANVLRGYLIAAVVLFAVASTLYLYLVFFCAIPERADRRIARRLRLSHGLLGTRTIAAVCGLLILLPLICTAVFHGSLYPKNEKAVVGIESSEYTIENYRDALQDFFMKDIGSLSEREKTNSLQIIANIQAQRLGLPHELNVLVGSESEGELANYSESTHTITLNVNYYDISAIDLTDTVCHEAYHAYQYALVNAYQDVDPVYRALPIFDSVRSFEHEFENYVHGEEDFETYFSQETEKSARNYAADEAQWIYLEVLAAYLEKKGSS